MKKKGFQRSDRVAEQVRRDLADLIRTELKDPRVGMISLTAALTVMLGADVGSALMAVVFSLDLSWLSPLCIFVGVVLYVARQDGKAGRVGRVLIGLGLMC